MFHRCWEGSYTTPREPAKAAEFVRQCLETATAKRSRKYVAMSRRLSGIVHLHRLDLDAAESDLSAAETLAAEIGHPSELWRARAALAELLDRNGNIRRAASVAAQAREVLEHIRDSLVDAELRAHYGTSAEATRVLGQSVAR